MLLREVTDVLVLLSFIRLSSALLAFHRQLICVEVTCSSALELLQHLKMYLHMAVCILGQQQM